REGVAVSRRRFLLVIADDFAIGPATTRGILDVAAGGRVTGTVLLVNSPYAEASILAWRQRGVPLEIGWHPCLTLDQPVVPAGRVPSLVREDGSFWPLSDFLRRWCLGRLRAQDIRDELHAQYRRFQDLLGRPPDFVNSHQHVQLFAPVGDLLLDL